jgi:DGQHR domain-containing protein
MSATEYNVIRFEQRHDGKPLHLYAGVISADELIDRHFVPVFDSMTRQGYQRPVYPSRLNSIASYVINKQGLMPTSVLVNIREGAEFHPNPRNPDFGKVIIDKNARFSMVDGQHRTKGMQQARLRQEPLPYSIPIVFAIGMSEFDEMRLFYVVNHEQKSVPTDLTLELMAKQTAKTAEEGGNVKVTQLRSEAATTIARTLAKDDESVWCDRIQLADEVRQTHKPIRFATFANSLGPFLSGDWATSYVISRNTPALTKVVFAYWQGLNELMPEAFADPKNYTIQWPTGTWAFGFALRDMVRKADRANDWSIEFFADELKVLERWVESSAWHIQHGDPMTRVKGRGMARLIFEQMQPLLTQEFALT